MTSDWLREGAGGAPLHHSPAKLTPAQRDEIHRRYRAGETSSALAREFGVTASHVRHLGFRGGVS